MTDDLEEQLAHAHRRETAVAGVLRAVAEGGADVGAVMFEIARHAAELCDADWGVLFLAETDRVVLYANGPAFESPTVFERPPGDNSALVRVLTDRTVIRFDDQSALTDPAFAQSVEAARNAGPKSALYVPLPAGGPAVGAAVFRTVIAPFSDDDVELLETLAVQAGIAVTNARQRSDIERRNTELAEALALQTATSEVLGLIERASR